VGKFAHDHCFYGMQVGDPGTDHAFWWKPNDEPAGFCRSVITVDKKHPAADVAASAAAALAAAAPLFQDDAAYQALLLQHAKQLYSFAVKYPGM
jgi:endoglucanase